MKAHLRLFAPFGVIFLVVVFLLLGFAPTVMAKNIPAAETKTEVTYNINGIPTPSSVMALAHLYDGNGLAGVFSRATLIPAEVIGSGGSGSVIFIEVLAPNINQHLGGYDVITQAAIIGGAGGNYVNHTMILAGLLSMTGTSLMAQNYLDDIQDGHLTGTAGDNIGLATFFDDGFGPDSSGGILVYSEPTAPTTNQGSLYTNNAHEAGLLLIIA